MNDETLSQVPPENNSTTRRLNGAAAVESKQTLAVAATFTADLLTKPLQFWMEQLEISVRVVQAPYAQLMQELFDPRSLLSMNRLGFNLLLLRLEDWIRDRSDAETQENLHHLRITALDFARAVALLRARNNTPLFIHFCPASITLPDVYRSAIDEHEHKLVQELDKLSYTHCSTHTALMRLYPLSEYENPQADRIAHIPYTQEYFAALATLFSRRIAALTKPQYKVIAIDCDNTLWQGVCGEDGPTGVRLTEAHLELQRVLVRQHDAGVLLTLCSKNNPADVEAVFSAHPEMPLRQEHLICSRINWKPKSENLRSLAKELDLALDSFILIDDSELECAEVQANCPGVLALHLPGTQHEILHFIHHVWAFDRLVVTEDAKQRTAQYRQNLTRSKALIEAGDLRQFLASLELKVDVSPMQAGDLHRVAELVQRTNQFNFTSIRRRASEIETLCSDSQLRCLVVRVRDRFGDYGLVGALLFRRTSDELDVDTFVLSCRVLGREVEHRIVNVLGRMALEEGCGTIVVRYRRTARNAPAWAFLESSFIRFRAPSQLNPQHIEEVIFRVPSNCALNLSGDSSVVEEEKKVTPEGATRGRRSKTSSNWHENAYRFSRPAELMAQLTHSSAVTPDRQGQFVAPQTPTQAAVAQIWAKVLGVSDVGLEEDFFELGGNSLLAVQVIASIGSVLGLEISIYEFFEAPTVREVARKLEQSSRPQEGVETFRSTEPIPLSSAQQRLWFIDRLEGGSPAYHVPLALRLRGELQVEALQAALNGIVNRHEALRTVFIEVDGDPTQQVQPNVGFELQRFDLHGREHTKVLECLSEEVAAPFDLSAGPLIRGALLRLGHDDHILLITMHHIVSDGWSLGVLRQEIVALYSEHVLGASDPLPLLPIQYADYAIWQRRWAVEPQVQAQLEYWKGHLQGAPALIALPTDRPRPATQSYRGANVPVLLGPELTKELKSLARELNLTLAMALYTAWAIVLMRLSGQQDVVIGMPVAARRRTEFEPLIGFFVNTLAVRVRCEDDFTVRELLMRVKETMIGAQAHQDAPFEHVVDVLQPLRSLSYSPIFQVVLAFQNTPSHALDLPDLVTSLVDVPVQAAQFDLSLTLQESAEGVSGVLNYASDLFDDVTIRRWVEHFMSVLKGMSFNLAEKASVIPLLSEHERRQVVTTFNETDIHYPRQTLLHELFEAQAERTPEAVAAEYEGRSLTFGELNSRANQLARYLQSRGVGPDRLVAICVEPSLELVVGLLGILKAGGAYVPLDPSDPPERLSYMLEDAAPGVLLMQERLRPLLPTTLSEVIALDDGLSEIGRNLTTNLDLRPRGQRAPQLAYVIYESDATGRPKGVMIEHENVVNLWRGLEQLYSQADACQRIGLNASITADASVQQFVQLLSGRTLFPIPEDSRRDPSMLLNFIQQHRIEAIDCMPSQLKSWCAAGLLERGRCPLHLVLIGGEVIDPELWSNLAQCSEVEFFNVYGPTECTVDATAAQLNCARAAPHMGRPMANQRVYILDRSGEPVPIGVSGEIYIGGAGVGRGYLNRPELTADLFLPDPFRVDAQGRMYKTGDLARWRADGTIEYLCRNDHQVNLRGVRVELGEIETLLVRCEQVREAAVIAREDVSGEKRLVAYVVPRSAAIPLAAEALRAHLRALLPDHMLPSAFVMLDRLPLTALGKLDRQALPAPNLDVFVSSLYDPPQGEVEEALAGIWQALLRVERVGRHDNFFELGGHSLLIVQMMERLRSAGLAAELRCVFEHPTLADLASALTPHAAGLLEVPPNLIPLACTEITPPMLPLVALEPEEIERIVHSVPGGAANIQDIYPLAPPQEGILFHHLLNEDAGDVYVLPILLSTSSRAQLDQLIEALQHVIDRHDVLRTAVRWEHLPTPVQVVYRQAPLPVREVALDAGREPEEQVQEWSQPVRQRVDIRNAPPMRLQFAHDATTGQWYVLLQLHHITIDHVTLEILISEVLAYLKGEAQQLSASVPYRNHVAQLLALSRPDAEEAFFRRTLGTVEEPTAPFGLIDVHGDGTQIEEASADVQLALARSLRTQAQRLGVSAATLFHAAWALVVACTSGRDEVVFGSVLLGRLQGSAGGQEILGLFTNSLPLKLQLHGMTANEFVEHTQREIIELLHHEQASLALAQRCSGIVGSGPLFTTLFNYRHTSTTVDALWSRVQGIRVLAIQERTNYPITLSVDDFGEEFKLTAQTDRRIDPHRIVHYLQTALQSLVYALERAPQAQALTLSVLPEFERRAVVELFNDTHATYPAHNLIHELFEEQAERTPDVPAVLHAGQSLTYAELNSRANRLARHLRAKGVGPDQLVAICLERSLEMVVGLLGILKAGGAYMPLDPKHPFERLQYMLEDAVPRVLLTSRELRVALPLTHAEVTELDSSEDSSSHMLPNLSGEKIGLTAQNLIYVIYTSGSTGRPKGTAMSHHSMINLIEWHRQNLRLHTGQRVLQFAALSFDVAFQETFSTLCMGGTLVLLDESVRRDPRALMHLLSAQSVERLFLPPLMLQSLAECFENADMLPRSLKDVITAGDQLRISREITELFKQFDGCRLHNHYGPTETHVVTTLTLGRNCDSWPTLPTIGKPVSNTQIYILNGRREALPIGVAGDIYVAGANVARGYFHRPELTADRFIADPFSTHAEARLYKTGDVGRWRADGTIEYLGRSDDQVKIRGFRIELREIEAQLSNHVQVREAVVVAREDVPGYKRLVAYVTPRDQAGPQAEELRAYLKGVLPEHMLPSAFIVLESLPLTPSGKLNRRALPPPQFASYVTEQYEPPQGEIEEAVARIWQELLQVRQVGRHDNFFDLGGHSLLAMKALLKVNQCIGCALKVTDMYTSPTPQELATRIGGSAVLDELIDLSQEAMLDDKIRAIPGRVCLPPKAVLLSGGTGFVGRFLLAQLLQDRDAVIYCLVRAQSQDQGLFGLRKMLLRWDLWRAEYEARIVAIPGDLRLPRVGMDEVTYQMLSTKIDSIYHCGVSMNHLETYAMAKSANVESVRELLKLATNKKLKQMNYVSTLGVFRPYSETTKRVVNEASLIDQEPHRTSNGYAASKWVGEKIIMIATERGIPCNIFRLGFVWADTQLGRYDESQRGYRILKSCLLSGYGIKNFRYFSPPTPVDYVARAVVFLANQHCDRAGIFHISSSNEKIGGLFERCNEILRTSLDLLPYYEWVCEVKRLHHEGQSLPIVPLIEGTFSMDEESLYENQRHILSSNVHFDCSETHRELENAGIVAPAIDDELLKTCIESMLSRDADLRQRMVGSSELMLAMRRVS